MVTWFIFSASRGSSPELNAPSSRPPLRVKGGRGGGAVVMVCPSRPCKTPTQKKHEQFLKMKDRETEKRTCPRTCCCSCCCCCVGGKKVRACAFAFKWTTKFLRTVSARPSARPLASPATVSPTRRARPSPTWCGVSVCLVSRGVPRFYRRRCSLTRTHTHPRFITHLSWCLLLPTRCPPQPGR